MLVSEKVAVGWQLARLAAPPPDRVLRGSPNRLGTGRRTLPSKLQRKQRRRRPMKLGTAAHKRSRWL